VNSASPVAASSVREAAALLPFGVIDIGSNSIRMAVFDEPLRLPTPRFNEKVLCGLGRSLGETGSLDEAGMQQGLTALRRFAALSRQMNLRQVVTVATAAVRDASNGPDFVARIEKETGLKIRVLTGNEEAVHSALGVISGIPEAEGVMGDLGGGSLELVAIDKRKPGENVTLPLGALRLASAGNYNQTKNLIDGYLADVPWLSRWKGKPLYAVGGSWRAIARVHMAKANSPLHIIHQYTLPVEEAMEFSRLLGRQSRESLNRIPGLPKRRQDSVPIAALVLRRLLKAMQPSEVIFSAHGLREGLAYAMLDEATRAQDPLLSYCRYLAQHEGRFSEHGDEVARFVAPLFERETPAERRIRFAAAILSDIAWRVHPDYRGEHAMGLVLHAAFGGITQRERAYLALAMFARYAGTLDDPAAMAARRMLSPAQADDALVIGLGLRLGQTLSGAVPGILRDCKLRFLAGDLVLDLPAEYAALNGEAVERRVEVLAKALNRGYAVRAAKS